MSTVQDVLGAGQVMQGATASGKGATENAQDRFLKLLVTQMKNQDPLNPMDNAQVTSQMAQISTVTGIEKLNATIGALSANLLGSQALATADLIGRSVLVPGGALQLEGGRAPFGVDLQQDAERVVITVQDGSGRAVQRVDLGAQKAGVLSLAWDGLTEKGEQAQPGAYRFTVEATAQHGKVEAHPLTQARVNGVIPGAQGLSLQLDRVGPVQLPAVKQIL